MRRGRQMSPAVKTPADTPNSHATSTITKYSNNTCFSSYYQFLLSSFCCLLFSAKALNGDDLDVEYTNIGVFAGFIWFGRFPAGAGSFRRQMSRGALLHSTPYRRPLTSCALSSTVPLKMRPQAIMKLITNYHKRSPQESNLPQIHYESPRRTESNYRSSRFKRLIFLPVPAKARRLAGKLAGRISIWRFQER
jgi:hypothetical protein